MIKQRQFNQGEKFAIQFIVSGTSAAISKTIASPIQVIKIRLQLQEALIIKKLISKPYLGIVDCFKRLYQQQGIRAYYKGNFTNVVRYFPTQALNFAFKDLFKKNLYKNPNNNASLLQKIGRNVLSGSLAGASTQFIVYPLDYVRTRLTNDIMTAKQKGSKQFNGIIDCMMKTFKSDGIRGIYRGFIATCLTMIIYRGIYFGINDSIKPYIQQQILENLFYNFLISYGITITSGIMSYPLDTVRRRMMMSSGQQHKFNSTAKCITHLYHQGGIFSFFRGVSANILRGVTGAGVLTLYDKAQLLVFGKKYKSGQ